MPVSEAAPKGIDPRGPRFAASLTAVLLLIATFFALTGLSTARGAASFVPGGVVVDPTAWALRALTVAQRAADPGFVLVLVIALLFLWGGVFVGLYTLAITIVGSRFSGGDLVGIYAVMSVAWGFGALAGPPLGGFAMGLTLHGLPIFAALACFAFVLVLLRRERGHPASRPSRRP